MEEAPEWPVVDSQVAWETPYFTGRTDRVRRPTGDVGEYYYLDPRDGVSVVAIRSTGETDRLLLVDQYRPRAQKRFLECPGGVVDADESPLEAARRELREETGFRAERLELLCTNTPSVWTRMTNVVVYATHLVDVGVDPEPGEVLEVTQVPVEEALGRTATAPVHAESRLALLEASERGYL